MNGYMPAAGETADNTKKIPLETEKWMERLSSLPKDTQQKISKKYYGGSMPWKTEVKK